MTAALFALLGADAAQAATLKANYQLDGDPSSEVSGAPDLVPLGKGNRFATEDVDGAAQEVLTFPKGGGLSLATEDLVDSRAHSVVMVFRLAALSGWRRLLDFSDGQSDSGLYSLFGLADLYSGDLSPSRGTVFARNTFAQVALTNAPAGERQRTIAYVNGTRVNVRTTAEGFDLEAGSLRLFKDNAVGGGKGEESAGALACLLVYDGTLRAAEVEEVAADPALCPAPRPRPAKPTARASGKPRVRKSDGSLSVDTGLVVRCPVGTAPCRASAAIRLVPRRRGAATSRAGGLARTRFTVQAGERRRVVVRLSRGGVKLLRGRGALLVRAFAEIAAPGGRKARARAAGRIVAPRPAAFRSGIYSGTTSQGLPIVLKVQGHRVLSVYFAWRARCKDGKAHTNTIEVGGSRVRRGRFSIAGRLNTGGFARVTGRLRGGRAQGKLSRTGASAFNTDCLATGVRWRARAAR